MADDILGVEEVADEAAFEAAFAGGRGEEPADEPLEPAPVEQDPADPAEPAPEVIPEAGPAAEPVKLIAGLTEEQLQAVLARSASLQGTVDKMAGRMGQLMQQVETMRNTPAPTPQAQQAVDLKLERLSESFPELASMLREDLKSATAPVVAEPAAPVVQGITQEQLDAALSERVAGVDEKIEVKVLSIMHPDWFEVIKTPQFALYRDTVMPSGAGEALMSSTDASHISKGLTEFKVWREKANAPVVVPPVVPPRAAERLANAVLPTGGAAVVQIGEISEEAAFAASFAAEQKRRGMA